MKGIHFLEYTRQRVLEMKKIKKKRRVGVK